MMSPVTCVTMLMFAGSGLYLYQAKHHAEMETRDIRRLVAEADAIRQHTGVLVTDYQLENDPERLGELATRFFPTLKPTQPTQFTTLADFEHRLPPVGLPGPNAAVVQGALVFDYPPAPTPAPVSANQPSDDGTRAGAAAKAAELAAKLRPVAKPVPVIASRDTPPRDLASPAAVVPYAQLVSSGRPAPSAFVSGAPVAATPTPSSLMANGQGSGPSRPPRPSYSPVVATAPLYPFGAQYASPYGGAAPSSGSALGMARNLAPHPYGQIVTPPLAPGGSGG